MPSPTTYIVNAFTVVLFAFSICSIDCLSFLTNAWFSSDTSFRYFWTEPSRRLATISGDCAGLPAAAAVAASSSAFSWATERSFSISSAGTWSADSDDLHAWTVTGRVLRTEGGHEGPNVFFFGGWWWLLVDTWAGQLAHRSTDLTTWEEAGTVLAGAHSQVFARTDDVGPGLHADVVVEGGRAWIFYFTHPDRVGTEHPTIRSRRSSIQVAELTVVDDRLVCDRDHVDSPELGTLRRPV
jgi:hypothetical protein